MARKDADSLDQAKTRGGSFADAPSESLGDASTFGDGAESLANDIIGDDALDDGMEVVDLSGRYEIEKVLGQGGMGQVLKAIDTRLKRPVAIKRVLGKLAGSRKVLQRFLTEAQSIAALNHFNIVQVYDYGRDKDGPFLIMEYVAGSSLLDLCQDGALPLEEAVELTCQLCDGLSKAHEAGIIHRDIKPANVLLTEDGAPKLTDFGLARQGTGDTGQTMAGAVLGTLDFMPPEQRKDATLTDARSDLWALAATLYQLVTGKSPKVIRLNAVPDVLQDVLGKALEEAPADRYQNASEFRSALRQAMKNAPSQSPAELSTGECRSCGLRNDEHRKFCQGCGTSLVEPCLKCLHEIGVWEEFCGECGASQKELSVSRTEELDQQRESVGSLRREYRYEEALQILKSLSDESHPRFSTYQVWANEVRPEVEGEYAETRAERERLTGEARALLSQNRYREVPRLFEQLSKGLWNSDVEGLLQQAERSLQESEELLSEIKIALRERKFSGLFEKTGRFLELRPDRQDIAKVHARLTDREEKRAAKKETRARERAAEILDESRERMRQKDFASVVLLLEDMPEGYESQESLDLLRKAQIHVERAELLLSEIEKAVKHGQSAQLLPKLDEYLKLVSNDKRIETLRQKLAGEQTTKRQKMMIASGAAATVLVALTIGYSLWSSSQERSRAIADGLERQAWGDVLELDGSNAAALVGRANQHLNAEPPAIDEAFADLEQAESADNSVAGLQAAKELAHAKRALTKALADQVVEAQANLREAKTLGATNTEPVTAKQALAGAVISSGTSAGAEQSDNSLGMKLMWCPPGSFTMGSPPDEPGRSPNEDQVEVTLSRGFWLGKHEVTQREWRSVMQTAPWKRKVEVLEADDCPATFASWEDAVLFCEKLTATERASGRLPSDWEYALPTEAQWEYACRAGTSTQFSFGDDEVQLVDFAWFRENAGDDIERYAHRVGQKRANSWGLHDMHGNVWEWCHDLYGQTLPGGKSPSGAKTGPLRVYRGGGWSNSAGGCRSALRGWDGPSVRSFNLGFRVLLSFVGSSTGAGEEQSDNSLGMKLVWCPPGKFTMGSPASEADREDTEGQVTVTLGQGFWLGKCEVTQQEWRDVMGTEPWKGEPNVNEGDNFPATYISWDDAMAFCVKLTASERESARLPDNREYTLPTEAQWEYACRSGTTTAYSFGNDATALGQYGWFRGNTIDAGERHPHEVGQKLANGWNLNDMHGNVFEWCWDPYAVELPDGTVAEPAVKGSHRGFRGGSWNFIASSSRSAHCRRGSPDVRSHSVGFRVLLSFVRPAANSTLVAASVPPTAIAPFDGAQAIAYQKVWADHLRLPIETTNSIGMKFVTIPPGEFTMGNSKSAEQMAVIFGVTPEANFSNDLPSHRVQITSPFHLGVTEVTQGQWEAVMGTRPWADQKFMKEGADYPALYVSWDDATEFCRKVSETEKITCRLPTEAEWEYACRAGSSTMFFIGDSSESLKDFAWFKDNASEIGENYAHLVERKRPNVWGLHDMVGNVWEWSNDWFSHDINDTALHIDPRGPPSPPSVSEAAPGRVRRGSAYRGSDLTCLSTIRLSSLPSQRHYTIGFRVVLEIPESVLTTAQQRVATSTSPPPAIAPFDAGQAKAHQKAWANHLGSPIETTNTIGMKFSVIPRGEFMMGEGKEAHQVTSTRPFELGVCEVTQEHYQRVMGTTPSTFKGKQNPVEQVNWDEAVAFCGKLSALPAEKSAGYVYRLPTEAEWEYACRAGTKTEYSFGDSESELGDYAWCDKNAGSTSHPVSGKKPNPWGLYDMHGNVWEWCQDLYGNFPNGPVIDPTGAASGSSRVRRGGSWINNAKGCRSGGRQHSTPDSRHDNLGFRVLRVMTPQAPPPAVAPFNATQAKATQPSLHMLTELVSESTTSITVSQDGLTVWWDRNGVTWSAQRGDLSGGSTFRDSQEWIEGRHLTISGDVGVLLIKKPNRESETLHQFTLAGGQPSRPREISTLVPDTGRVFSPYLSSNGDVVCFAGRVNGLQPQLFFSKRSKSGLWTIALPLLRDSQLTDNWTWPSLSDDGKVLLTTNQGPGVRDDESRYPHNIFIARRTSVNQSFTMTELIDLPGMKSLWFQAPRYLPETGELFVLVQPRSEAGTPTWKPAVIRGIRLDER